MHPDGLQPARMRLNPEWIGRSRTTTGWQANWMSLRQAISPGSKDFIRLPGPSVAPKGSVTIIIEMESEPLARLAKSEMERGAPLAANAQRAYSQELLAAQAPVAEFVAAQGGLVMGQYTKVYNGLLARLPLAALYDIESLAGVKAIHRAPVHTPSLASTIPHIRADRVVEDLDITGKGIRIAVIDTGIDYGHAAFGGSGNPQDYLSNNPNIIEAEHPFPTAKVIGGYDFAGTNYSGETGTPQPDPDPLDEYNPDGHGTHVASIAAGLAVPPKIGHGVAPEASLYAIKIFGKGGGSELMISGIEWAVDPNGDGDLSDRADVINLSIGDVLSKDDPNNPDTVAVDSAVMAGVVVVAAAGNEGYGDGDRNNAYEFSSPGVVGSAIGVAASASGSVPGPTLEVVDVSAPLTQTNIAYFTITGSHVPSFTVDLEAPLFYVGTVTTDTLCTIPPELIGQKPLAGKVALLRDGIQESCFIPTQANNAAELGAVAALVFNNQHRWMNMRRYNASEDEIKIPVGLLIQVDGLALIPAHLKDVRIHPQNEFQVVVDHGFRPDQAAFFSSRGPAGGSSTLKPDISAPGVSIYAALKGGGREGEYDIGTSMATPVVAGSAALVRQAHPFWTPEQVKAALMNRAAPMPDPASAVFSLSGAGRVDALAAVQAQVLAFGKARQPALNLGRIPVSEAEYVTTGIVTLQNTEALTRTYDASWSFAGLSPTQGITLTLYQDQLMVPRAPALASLKWKLRIDGASLSHVVDKLPEYYGYIVFTNQDDPLDILRVPFYAVVQAETKLQLSKPELAHSSGTAQVLQSGPINSQTEIFPLLYAGERVPDMPETGNLRFAGLNLRQDPQYGPVLRLALSVYGAWNAYWQVNDGEWSVEVDRQQNGSVDYYANLCDEAILTYGLAGAPPGQHRMVEIEDGGEHIVGLSPLPVIIDYNSGWMILEIPLNMIGLDLGAHSKFGFRIVWKDPKSETDLIRVDLSRMPLNWDLSGALGPGNREATIHFSIADAWGYAFAKPLGLLVLDPTGAAGVGQAYPLYFKFDQPFVYFAPIITQGW